MRAVVSRIVFFVFNVYSLPEYSGDSFSWIGIDLPYKDKPLNRGRLQADSCIVDSLLPELFGF